MKQKLIDELLTAQLAIARADNCGGELLDEHDRATLRAVLYALPGIIERVENLTGQGGGVSPPGAYIPIRGPVKNKF